MDDILRVVLLINSSFASSVLAGSQYLSNWVHTPQRSEEDVPRGEDSLTSRWLEATTLNVCIIVATRYCPPGRHSMSLIYRALRSRVLIVQPSRLNMRNLNKTYNTKIPLSKSYELLKQRHIVFDDTLLKWNNVVKYMATE